MQLLPHPGIGLVLIPFVAILLDIRKRLVGISTVPSKEICRSVQGRTQASSPSCSHPSIVQFIERETQGKRRPVQQTRCLVYNPQCVRQSRVSGQQTRLTASARDAPTAGGASRHYRVLEHFHGWRLSSDVHHSSAAGDTHAPQAGGRATDETLRQDDIRARAASTSGASEAKTPPRPGCFVPGPPMNCIRISPSASRSSSEFPAPPPPAPPASASPPRSPRSLRQSRLDRRCRLLCPGVLTVV